MLDEWPEISEMPSAPARRTRWSHGTFVSLTLSIGIHALALVVLVRMGVLRGGPSPGTQGGAVGTGIGDGRQEAVGMSAEPSAQLPPAVRMTEPRRPNLAAPALEDSAMVMTTREKTPSQLLNDTAFPQMVGVPVGGVPALPTSSRRLPDGLRNPSGGGSENGGAHANARSQAAGAGSGGDATYLMNHAGAGSEPVHDGSGRGPLGGGGDDGTGPTSRNRPPPYPAQAKRLQYEGTVVLLVEVLEDGTTGKITVDESSGYDILDRAAVDAAKRYQYSPTRIDGRAVTSKRLQPIKFALPK